MSSQVMPDLISLEPYDPKTALPEALSLLEEAAGSEREDELFYDYLLGQAQREEDIEVITAIRDDERKHNLLFRQIYALLTGSTPPAQEPGFEPPVDYCDGLRRALFGELAAVEKYRRILFGLSYNLVFANVVTEIYTDELKHAAKWNYLFCRNECCEDEKAED